MIAAIDRWIGKTLFVPPIVRFCQRFGVSQFLVHNYLYLIGSYMLLIAAIEKNEAVGTTFVLALILTIKIGRNPEYEGHESRFLRYFLIFTNVIHVAAHVTGKHVLWAGYDWDMSCPVGFMWLAAEYARTIKTIPPLEDVTPASERLIETTAKRVG